MNLCNGLAVWSSADPRDARSRGSYCCNWLKCYDKGYTWENVRLVPNTPDMMHGLCPSDLVQLPDGRLVWMYTHRYGEDSGVLARVGLGGIAQFHVLC